MGNNLTKEYIFKAFNAMLSKKHYNDITVGEICTKAGVSRMSFYRIFSSKDDLTFKSLDMVVDQVKSNIEMLEHKNGFTITKTIFETIQKYSNVISSFEESSIAKNIVEYVATKFQSKIPNDYILKTSKYLPIFYFSAITAVVATWLKDGTKESPDEMARLLVSLMNKNIFKNENNEKENDELDCDEFDGKKFDN